MGDADWSHRLSEMNEATIRLKWQFLEFFVHANNSRACASAVNAVNCAIQEQPLGQGHSSTLEIEDWSEYAAILEHFGQWFQEAEGARKKIDAFTMEANNLTISEAKKRNLVEQQQQKWTAETERELAEQSNSVREVLKFRDAEQRRITAALGSLALSQKVLGRMCGLTVCSFQSQVRDEMADMFQIPRVPSAMVSMKTDVSKSEAKTSRRSTSSLEDLTEVSDKRTISRLSNSSICSVSSVSSRPSISPAPLKKSVSSHTLKEEASSKPSLSRTSSAVVSSSPSKSDPKLVQSEAKPSRKSASRSSSTSAPSAFSSSSCSSSTSSNPASELAQNPFADDVETTHAPVPASASSVTTEASELIEKTSIPKLPAASPLNPFDAEGTLSIVTNSKHNSVAKEVNSRATNPFDDPSPETPAAAKSKNPFEVTNPFDDSSTNPFAT